MILGLASLITANAAVLLGARALLDRLRSGKPAIDFVLFLLARLLLISLVVLAFGAARLLTPLALGLAGAAALAILVARGAHRGLTLPRELPWGALLSAVLLLLGARLLYQVWTLAPYLGDTLAYHLPKVAEWVRAGAITNELGPDSRATFPAGFELIEVWWTVFLHHDVLIELAGVEFLLLAGAGVYALAVELGWSARSAMTAALFFILGPAVYFQAVSCMNDGPASALFIAATALLVARQSLLLVAVPLALGAGVKPSILYACPGLALLAVWLRRDGVASGTTTKTAAAAAAGAAVAGATWYVRNWVLFGNPIYPMGPGGMRSTISGATFQRLGPSLQSFRENLACFLDIRVYDRSFPPDAMCTGNFNWGAAAFALGVPALIVVLRSEPLLRRIAVAYAVSVLCVFALVELDLFYTRFILFLAVLPSLALARLAERQPAVALLGALALVSQGLATQTPGNLPAEVRERMASTGWRDRSAFEAPADAVPGYATDECGSAYSLYGPDFSRRVVYLRDQTPAALLDHARKEGVTALYVSGIGRGREAVFEAAAAKEGLRPFQRGPWKGYALQSRN